MSAASEPSGSTATQEWTVRRILEWTIGHLEKHGSDTPRLDAEILLAEARGCRRIELYTQYDQPLSDEQRAVMRDLVKRRAGAEPVAYLVGHKEFFNLDFIVGPDVLIPRPDTETLVMETLALTRDMPGPRVLEIGTGSGCIAVTLAKRQPGLTVTTVDVSPQATDVARQNAERHKVADRVTLLTGDAFAAVPAGERFDFVVSNPPYVPHEEIAQLDPDVRLHEPHLALDGGRDGLDMIRRLVTAAPDYLTPGGHLLFEIGYEQGAAARGLLTDAGRYTAERIIKDLSKHDRVAAARLA